MNESHAQYALQVKLKDGWTFVSYGTSYNHADELIWEDNIIDAAFHIKNWREYEGRVVRRRVSEWTVVS